MMRYWHLIKNGIMFRLRLDQYRSSCIFNYYGVLGRSKHTSKWRIDQKNKEWSLGTVRCLPESFLVFVRFFKPCHEYSSIWSNSMANSLPSLTIFATQEIEPVHLRESQYKSLNQDRLLWRSQSWSSKAHWLLRLSAHHWTRSSCVPWRNSSCCARLRYYSRRWRHIVGLRLSRIVDPEHIWWFFRNYSSVRHHSYRTSARTVWVIVLFCCGVIFAVLWVPICATCSQERTCNLVYRSRHENNNKLHQFRIRQAQFNPRILSRKLPVHSQPELFSFITPSF